MRENGGIAYWKQARTESSGPIIAYQKDFLFDAPFRPPFSSGQSTFTLSWNNFSFRFHSHTSKFAGRADVNVPI